MKRIVLCADDYGQNSAISQAIVELVKAKNLSAVSCLVTHPGLSTHAKELAVFKNSIDIGLHFNLTEAQLLTRDSAPPTPLKHLILQANFRMLRQKNIQRELTAQLNVFTNTFNQLPDFIDGHQHIHQLPVIRDALLAVYNERLRENGTYFRCTYSQGALTRIQTVAYFKQLIIQFCGGINFKQSLVKQKIPHNSSFAGIYDFKNAGNYPALFPQFLDQITDGGIIMCHPGLAGAAADMIVAARNHEYHYFSSPQFLRDLKNQNATLVRFKELTT